MVKKLFNFKGEYRNNQKEGQGTTYYNNGDRHKGEYRDNKRDGNGVMFFVSGDRLEGSFRDAFSNGILYCKNGDKFEGKIIYYLFTTNDFS